MNCWLFKLENIHFVLLNLKFSNFIEAKFELSSAYNNVNLSSVNYYFLIFLSIVNFSRRYFQSNILSRVLYVCKIFKQLVRMYLVSNILQSWLFTKRFEKTCLNVKISIKWTDVRRTDDDDLFIRTFSLTFAVRK